MCEQLRSLDRLFGMGLPIGWSAEVWPRVVPFGAKRAGAAADGTQGGGATAATAAAATEAARRPAGALALAAEPPAETFSANWWANLPLALFGWVLIGVSATLGSAFWFDILNKLVKLRGAGVRPADNAPPAAAGAANTMLAASAPAAAAATGPAENVHPPSDDAMNDAERGLTERETRTIQLRLGLTAAQQTGRLDLATRDAIRDWQRRSFGSGDGLLTPAQIGTLLNATFGSEDDGYLG
jgi:hypothetical protein